ncbi:MAG: hypothetical protein ACOYYS_15340 [Chloroflexota bacterium]
MKHLDTATLLDYIEQTLDLEAWARVSAHIDAPCALCQAKLAQLVGITTLMADDRTYAPPAAVFERGMQAFRKAQLPRARPQFVASLVFDSLRQPSLAAVRGVGAARQYLYTASVYDIDLRVKNDDNSLSVMGQILGSEGLKQPHPQVCLKQEQEILDCLATDARGRFFFKQVTPGDYQLFFQFDEMEIAINDLSLA